MLSVPPATTISASAHFTACAASITAFSPDPQTLFTVWAGTESGMPARMEAWRAGFMPRPAWRMQPRITSSTWSGRTEARRTASLTATAPRSTADTSLKAPPKLPIGVRQPLRTTTSSVPMNVLPAEAYNSGRGRTRRSVPPEVHPVRDGAPAQELELEVVEPAGVARLQAHGRLAHEDVRRAVFLQHEQHLVGHPGAGLVGVHFLPLEDVALQGADGLRGGPDLHRDLLVARRRVLYLRSEERR